MKYLIQALFWPFTVIAFYLTQLVVFLDRKSFLPSKFPKNLSQLSDKWIWKAMQESGSVSQHSSLVSYEAKTINESEIFRSDTALISLNFLENNETKQLNALAKFSPSSGSISNRAVFNLQQNQVKEINFYLFLSQRIPQLVPKVYKAQFDLLTGNSILLMEFIDESINYNEVDGCTENQYAEVAKVFATFHAAYWGLKSHEVFGILAIPKIIADFFQSTCWNKWKKESHTVFEQNWLYMNVEQSLIHGDARVGNLLFAKDGIKLIDWQAARISKASYDLAYFIILSLPIQQREQQEVHLLKIYYKHLLASGVKNYSESEFEEDYKHACIMVLTMLSIPWLSGEGSFDEGSTTLLHFLIGHQFWIARLEAKFANFDYSWMSQAYKMDENAARLALKEFLQGYKNEMKNLAKKDAGIEKRMQEMLQGVKIQ
jgi:thiamine kinase-like enzyme